MSNKQEYRDALAKEFLEALKQPEIEYYCPWYSFAAQRNGFTDRKYNGLNSLYLNLVAYKNNWTDSRWFTFTQLKKLNESRKPEEAYSVKGQHGMPVEFFTVYDVQEKKKISLIEYYKILRNASDEQLKDIQRRYRVHNEYTTVFNAHQIQNMELIQKDKMNLKDIDSKNIEDLAKSIKVDLKHESIDRAFYNKKEDAIHLPFAEFFKSQNDYNYTALHELSHSTGHESRLSRDLSGTFGTEQYAIEELIAEMSCSFYGFNLDKNSDPKILNNHKAYIQSWAKVIENDPKKFFDAVSQAQKAADFLEEHSDFLKEKEISNVKEGSLLQEIHSFTESLNKEFNRSDMDKMVDSYCKEISSLSQKEMSEYVLEADKQRFETQLNDFGEPYNPPFELNSGHIYTGLMNDRNLFNRFAYWLRQKDFDAIKISPTQVEEAIRKAGKLDLKKYQDKANEHNKELKKNVASLEVKKDEEEI